MTPSSQYAIQQDSDGQPYINKEANIPELPPGYALIKTFAVALNPSDQKIFRNFPIPGARAGIDFSGSLVKVADDVDIDAMRPGMLVSGASFCFSPEHRQANGAFAEYVRSPADLLFHIPSPLASNTIGLVRAATFPTTLWTCLLAFWSKDGLGLVGTPDAPHVSNDPVSILVYGGSTATGTIAIQLLKLSGYDPIATCSPRNFDLVTQVGATAVFDYSVPDVAAKIKLHTRGRLKYVLDCISTAESVAICYSAIQRPGGQYVSLEHIPDKLLAKRRGVRASFVLAAEISGEEIKLGDSHYDRPASMEKRELAARYRAMFQQLIDLGKLRSHPIEIVEGGLQGVLTGLEILEARTISGKKLAAILDSGSRGIDTAVLGDTASVACR